MRKELGIFNIKITLLDVKLGATILDPTQDLGPKVAQHAQRAQFQNIPS